MNKILTGLVQALGTAVYCMLIACLFLVPQTSNYDPMGSLGTVFMLLLLVFSVAVVGSIIFGYPAYLVIQGKTKEAVVILCYTLLFCLIILGVIGVVVIL